MFSVPSNTFCANAAFITLEEEFVASKHSPPSSPFTIVEAFQCFNYGIQITERLNIGTCSCEWDMCVALIITIHFANNLLDAILQPLKGLIVPTFEIHTLSLRKFLYVCTGCAS